MRTRAVQVLQLEADLRRALKRREFELHYQPIVCLADNRLAGFEALIRWRKSDGTLVPPADFIPLCEETDMILPIGDWVLNEACAQLSTWLGRYPRTNMQISVNLSVRQLRQKDLLFRVRDALDSRRLPPERLKLEITESAVMDNADLSSAILNELNAMQISLSIDDFGTGYSSLNYLRRLPVNTLKIDQSFVRGITNDRKQAGIVESTIILAHKLGMDVIAEGVETHEQARQLRSFNAEYGQGYLFARPLQAGDAEQLLAG
ncbi:hypothetical protein CAI21_20860 [Alkalilimnicola ehrlichii]|nr:EAL domain-containing protein [Alkalilimnicola ehrlichii]RFA24666.1 hypothetical protein CAI21_20860 [Alkalilimnicola ehrlichii]